MLKRKYVRKCRKYARNPFLVPSMEAGNFVTESRVRFPMSPLPCTIMMMIGVIVLGGDYFEVNGDDYFPMS